MLAEAAEIVASRQSSKKKPRLYGDYREMLKEKDLDIVRSRHARPLARAADDRRRREPALTSTCQKPISVDVVEGQAMLAAARKHERVVQVGTQRRSTPHLDRSPRTSSSSRASSAKSAWSRSAATTTCAPPKIRPTPIRRPNLDYEMWTGPAPMRPYNKLVHPRGWRAFMEYGNGIVGDMCIHMFDMTRWMLDLGWPKRVSSTGGIFDGQEQQGQHLRHADRHLRLSAISASSGSTAPGATRPIPKYPWARHLLRRQRHAQSQRVSATISFPKAARASRVHRDVTYELEQYPEDKTEKDLEKHCRPGHPPPHEGFPRRHRQARQARRRHRARLHLDRQLHPGQPLDEARPHAHLGRRKRSASSATTKPTACCGGRIARRGCIRKWQAYRLSRLASVGTRSPNLRSDANDYKIQV